jgi:glycine cleavage system H protein
MEFPADLKYAESDEWIRVEDNIATVGLTDYAQDQLSDVVYVEVTAEVGDTLAKDEAFGTVESVKAASDMYMPISGKITAVNEALVDTPELVNSDPYGEAWVVKFEITDPDELDGTMDAAGYEKYTKEREG